MYSIVAGAVIHVAIALYLCWANMPVQRTRLFYLKDLDIGAVFANIYIIRYLYKVLPDFVYRVNQCRGIDPFRVCKGFIIFIPLDHTLVPIKGTCQAEWIAQISKDITPSPGIFIDKVLHKGVRDEGRHAVYTYKYRRTIIAEIPPALIDLASLVPAKEYHTQALAFCATLDQYILKETIIIRYNTNEELAQKLDKTMKKF